MEHSGHSGYPCFTQITFAHTVTYSMCRRVRRQTPSSSRTLGCYVGCVCRPLVFLAGLCQATERGCVTCHQTYAIQKGRVRAHQREETRAWRSTYPLGHPNSACASQQMVHWLPNTSIGRKHVSQLPAGGFSFAGRNMRGKKDIASGHSKVGGGKDKHMYMHSLD